MIRTVRIQNFKSLRDVSIDMERFTVFVGANGSGKTSVLEAIHDAVRVVSGTSVEQVFAPDRHPDWLYTRGGTGDISIQLETEEGEIGLEFTPPVEYPPPPEMMQRRSWQCRISPSGVHNPRLRELLGTAGSIVFLRFSAALLARPAYSSVDPPQVEYNGEGLASVLAYMALSDPVGLEELTAVARELIPRLRRIRFRREPVHLTEQGMKQFGGPAVDRQGNPIFRGELILLDFDHAENVSARSASEGTMLILGLITVLCGPTRPRTLLIDDIEHGLHPLAQKQLVEVIGKMLEKFPDLQILATSHSPFLLDFLNPEQVRIMATGPDGYSLCGRLTDHPKFPTWKEEMAPGEMWSLFGEKWLAEKAVSS